MNTIETNRKIYSRIDISFLVIIFALVAMLVAGFILK